jgi:molybdopterin-guanine dinucleotide biosynthesis protein A
MKPVSISGLVLSGGFSTRMGRDKGSLDWEGRPLVFHQAAKLQQLVPEVYISCRHEQARDYSGAFPLLPDSLPSGGPMSGLLSAMRQRPELAWLVLAVDMPLLQVAHLQWLLDRRDPGAIATVFRQADGIIQPLVGVWAPAAAPLLEKAFAEGKFSLRRLLERSNAHILDAPADVDLANINTLDNHAGLAGQP